MYSRQTTIINRTGLHARPASDFVLEAKKYVSAVTIRRAGTEEAPVNAKSIMRLLAQSFTQGTEVEIIGDGGDAQTAVDNLVALLETGFGEV